jgi:hypothetical protein
MPAKINNYASDYKYSASYNMFEDLLFSNYSAEQE